MGCISHPSHALDKPHVHVHTRPRKDVPGFPNDGPIGPYAPKYAESNNNNKKTPQTPTAEKPMMIIDNPNDQGETKGHPPRRFQ
jgi:hypothetical protein